MKQYFTLFGFGVLIFFLPFLGFPSSWKTAFLFIAGLVISGISLSFVMRERRMRQAQVKEASSPHEIR